MKYIVGNTYNLISPANVGTNGEPIICTAANPDGSATFSSGLGRVIIDTQGKIQDHLGQLMGWTITDPNSVKSTPLTRSFVVGDQVVLKNKAYQILEVQYEIILMVSGAIQLKQIKDPSIRYILDNGILYVGSGLGTRIGSNYYIEHLGAHQQAANHLADQMTAAMLKHIPVQQESPCDCGGFKTYESLADHYHSDWCKSRSKT